MSTILSIGQLATAILFGAAGISHIKNPLPLSRSLASLRKRHQRHASKTVVVLWGALEGALSILLILALVDPNGISAMPARATAVLVSAGYVAFLVYSVSVGYPWCACNSHRSRVNTATVARPLLMGGACIVSADMALGAYGGGEIAGILLAGFALAILGWSLPEAIGELESVGSAVV